MKQSFVLQFAELLHHQLGNVRTCLNKIGFRLIDVDSFSCSFWCTIWIRHNIFFLLEANTSNWSPNRDLRLFHWLWHVSWTFISMESLSKALLSITEYPFFDSSDNSNEKGLSFIIRLWCLIFFSLLLSLCEIHLSSFPIIQGDVRLSQCRLLIFLRIVEQFDVIHFKQRL